MSYEADSRALVYISGPIAKGDQHFNYMQFVIADWQLREAGLAPINPGLTMNLLKFPYFQGLSHSDWLNADIPLVDASAAVLRLPGESKGADIEVVRANAKNIPVFYAMEDLLEHFDKDGPISDFKAVFQLN
jgi:hypothetical protein